MRGIFRRPLSWLFPTVVSKTRNSNLPKDYWQYLLYVASALRFRSFRSWKADGRPNPFIAKRPTTRRYTSRQEIMDIFDDQAWLRARSRVPSRS